MSDIKPRKSYTRPPGAKPAGENATRATPKPGNSAAATQIDWKSFSRLLLVMLWAGTLASVGFGLHVLRASAGQALTQPTRIEWVNKPAWLDSDAWRPVLEELERVEGLYPDQENADPAANERLVRRAGITSETDIYHDDVCRFVGAQLAQSPWIGRLDRVTKVSDGRIRVAATFRRPFALVEKSGTAYLIDEHGIRLPRQLPVADVSHEQWLAITGVQSPAPAIR